MHSMRLRMINPAHAFDSHLRWWAYKAH